MNDNKCEFNKQNKIITGGPYKDNTITADDNLKCIEGGSTGKFCDNQLDCNHPKFYCAALAYNRSITGERVCVNK